jgi:hypothetical protein
MEEIEQLLATSSLGQEPATGHTKPGLLRTTAHIPALSDHHKSLLGIVGCLDISASATTPSVDTNRMDIDN